jgi:hypothetical protein
MEENKYYVYVGEDSITEVTACDWEIDGNNFLCFKTFDRIIACFNMNNIKGFGIQGGLIRL